MQLRVRVFHVLPHPFPAPGLRILVHRGLHVPPSISLTGTGTHLDAAVWREALQ